MNDYDLINIYIEKLKKYNIKYQDYTEKNIDIIFEELCKIPNINYLLIKKYFNRKSKNINNLKNLYDYIFNNFKDSSLYNIINNIESIKYFIKYIDVYRKNILINEINNKIEIYTDRKDIYTSLKTLHIYCNKNVNTTTNNINIIKKVNSILNAIQNTTNIQRIIFYVNKLSVYIDKNSDLEYNKIIDIVQNILYNDDIIKINKFESILNLINKCKKNQKKPLHQLENILVKIDPNIYDYIYFLNNNSNLLINKEKILLFLLNLNYTKKNFREIDSLNLKRGFVQGISKNNKNYLLKYQPNKSIMEIVLNTFLKTQNNSYFLTPSTFFINEDNSYFYIIEKYQTDLYKYFSMLLEKNKILTFNQIIDICGFIIKSIEFLHKNNIIHSDLKLENIVLNMDNDNNISELKIIDFDVGLFNTIPENILPLTEEYEKVFNNKKVRGTRIYMLKDKLMSFKNDIYSLGVIALILLYKNIRLIIALDKKNLCDDNPKNKNIIIKNQNLMKKLNKLRDKIEDNKNKVKILDLIDIFLKNNNSDFFDNNIYKFKFYKEFIINCLSNTFDINEIINKYNKLLFV